MAAYMIVDLTVTDPEGFATYREMVPPTIAAYGGKYLVRGGAISPMEGDWDPARITVLEFPSVERAKAWWDSPEYAEAKALRQRTAETKMIIVEGLG
jgi:uncharacterized protein (DUF1330 family)